MDLQEFYDYKNQLMKDVCSNEEIVKLIKDTDKVSVPDKSIIYQNVYPYQFIPDTADKAQTFVCFDVDIAGVESDTFYVPVIYIWVFTHKSKLRLKGSGGIRLDKLSAEINKILNGSRYYGLGELKLAEVGRFSPIKDYQGRVLTYYAKDFNKRGSKEPPANRLHRR